MTFRRTPKQVEASRLLAGPAMHVMLFGGSRSGKTFIKCRADTVRALQAPGSRHAIVTDHFNSIKTSVGMDTMPKVLDLCWPEMKVQLDRTDWVFRFPNGSEIWLLGLDDKERAEKVLGKEFATIDFVECSRISWLARNTVMTRLAQNVETVYGKPLRHRAFYDCNPPAKTHWTYRVFIAKRDPDTSEPLPRPEQYVSLQMNPRDNRENLQDQYFETLESLPARMRLRFLEGEFADDVPGALWRLEDIEKWRVTDQLPDMVRVVVAVDPSGSGDKDNADNDEIGIIVAGLGVDGNGYVLEDLTCKAGPATWGNLVTSAYDRHMADVVVAEQNYGGEMVRHVIQTARPKTPYRSVTATRGKHVRAEPISALYETGKIRHAGKFHKLEDEMCSFSTSGYVGSGSPNRTDALVWACTELFSGIVKEPAKPKVIVRPPAVARSWMAA